MKITILGCGNMGLTYARAFLQYHKTTFDDLTLIAKDEKHATELNSMKLGKVITGITPDAMQCDVLILAVKPQDFIGVAGSLKGKIPPETLLISILAGVKLDTLQEKLGHKYIVRAMPNMPAQFGMGITVYIPSSDANVHHLSTVENLLNTTGRTFMIENENLMDGVTALSGSGPAYFYYIVKIMTDTAKKMGFDESLANLLVMHTMHGAFHVMNNSDTGLDELIRKVASKGGTTEAALKTMKDNKFDEIFATALLNAEKRSKELSELNGK
ncbi:pyrroline-5-carboxylate reductase [Melioribacter roseus P3M-2]|uniref:Pyrroline-5-carboxylate reductase n=1 Tax=Melioribacter roseus (strain DSM 23840 / JCM 17771 / VKM B-2668 / P3M-2) TaxID=1191523 RepID=I6Z2X2_MELRP|nr:pyrroline-5-carboxylate reductase [Melioribacter roseus]AFN73475.1 pyrroline-5-carboxylate reductase [Melioribacter roseus P3M-2]